MGKVHQHKLVIQLILKEDGTTIIYEYDELSISFDWEIDCTTQAKCQNIKRHNHFDFVLKAKLDWSKNILEEQDAPWQAVLASNDHIYCVHLSLALWLESMQQNLPWLH